MNTSFLSLLDDAHSTEGANPANAAIELAAHWNGPSCDKCEAPLKSDLVAICRRCGWYSSLGQFVEVDPNWETHDDNAPAVPTPQPSHLQIWANLLPGWAWLTIGTVVAIVAESIAARLFTSDAGNVRMWWSLGQLMIGVLLFLGCHVLNFMIVASDDPDCGSLDLVLRPLRVWLTTFRGLPQRLGVVNGAAAGLTAAVMSVAVIGALPYERLWDWGFKQPPKHDLLGAVASQVQRMEGEKTDDLEQAIQNFAAQQNLTEDKKLPPAPDRPEVECVILGYQLDGNGKLANLLLGTAHKGKLAYAGTAAPAPESEEAEKLVRLLAQVRVDRPFLPLPMSALWVKPVYACRVNCDKQSAAGRLQNASWKELIGSMR